MVAGELGGPTIAYGDRVEQLGSETDHETQGSSWGKESLKNSGCKNLWGVAVVGETPSLSAEFIGENHRVLEHTQTYPQGNQQQKGPICLWVAREVTESWPRAEQASLFPIGPLPNIEHHNAAMWIALPWQIPKVPPLTV